jgi:hypothetical protein
MFGMFGLGIAEIAILAIVGLLILAVIGGVIAATVIASSSRSRERK